MLESGKESRILLVGEGNFSFTIALLKKVMTECSNISVLSSCYQKYSQLSSSEKQNAKEANRLGAEIWFNVDATNLSSHEKIGTLMFDSIIFNFPHVGGKMKIHLNKALLKGFFKSASLRLATDGRILVTLCQGQSGTCYDSAKRKFCDSWQVITMASFGDLVLKHVAPFSVQDWPEYYCKGYRSLDKGFHIKGALTYSFSKYPLAISPLVMDSVSCDSVHCPYIVNRLLHFTQNSCQSQIFPEMHLFQSYFQRKGVNFSIVENEMRTICLCSTTSEACLYDGDIPGWTLSAALFCRPCHSRGSADPVERVVLVCAPASERIEGLLDFLKVRCQICSTTDPTVVEYCDEDNHLKILTLIRRDNIQVLIYLDEFIKLVTHFPHNLGEFPREFHWPIKSLYPPTYQHHLSFWIPENFTKSRFACVLHQIAGPLIRSFRLIDEFRCDVSNRQSLCYEISYQSFEGSLSPDRAWDFHLNIIGGSIEKILGVNIR